MSIFEFVENGFRRTLALATCALLTLAVSVVGVASAASAEVTDGNTNVSCSSTSYAKFTTYWHRTEGPTSFWNNASSRTVDVRVNLGSLYHYATLSSGQWQGWTTAQSPIGFWEASAKAHQTTSTCGTFGLNYSIVHRPW